MGRTPPGQTREQVFRLVRDRLLAGRPPTVREVQEAFGFRSVQTAREHLEALVGEGRLSKDRGKARGYGLPLRTRSGPPTRLVPLLGRVQAGALNFASEDIEDYLPVQSRRSAEDLRMAAEQIRLSSEASRAAAELSRAAAEEARNAAEIARQKSDEAREQAEKAREAARQAEEAIKEQQIIMQQVLETEKQYARELKNRLSEK